MNLAIFSLKSVFNAKGLSHFRRLWNSPVGATAPGRAQTSSPSECFRVRIPENAQAALAKTFIRSKTARFIYRKNRNVSNSYYMSTSEEL